MGSDAPKYGAGQSQACAFASHSARRRGGARGRGGGGDGIRRGRRACAAIVRALAAGARWAARQSSAGPYCVPSCVCAYQRRIHCATRCRCCCQTVVRDGAAWREGLPVQPGLQHEPAVGRDAPRDLRQPGAAALHQPAAAVAAAHDGVERVRRARPQERHLLRRARHALAGHGAGGVRRQRHRRRRVRRPPAQEVAAQQRQEDQGQGQDQDGVHREQAAAVHDVLKEEDWHHEEGVRAVDTDRDAGDAPGGVGDGTRVHVRHPKTPTHDHERGRQGAHPDLPELPGSSGGVRLRGPADVGHRIRGDGTHLQHQRRGLQSKTNGVRFAAYTHARAFSERPGPLLAPRAGPSGPRGLPAARGLLAGLPQPAAAPAPGLRTPATPALALAHDALASSAVGGRDASRGMILLIHDLACCYHVRDDAPRSTSCRCQSLAEKAMRTRSSVSTFSKIFRKLKRSRSLKIVSGTEYTS